ncbi:MAG: MBL fold metallo-hydrolase [Candidatus Coprovivens sp.]
MKVTTFSTGSQGNCYLVEFSNGINILLDCGIPMKSIIKKMAYCFKPLNEIKLCLISHAHNDHIKSKEKLNLRGIKADIFKEYFEYEGLEITPIQVIHGQEECYSYVIKCGDEIIFYATDFTSFKNTNDLKELIKIPFDKILIECNYIQDIIDKEIYSGVKEIRQENTHTDLSYVVKLLSLMNLSRCDEILLIHLSDKYSDKSIMCMEVTNATHKYVKVAKRNGDV